MRPCRAAEGREASRDEQQLRVRGVQLSHDLGRSIRRGGRGEVSGPAAIAGDIKLTWKGFSGKSIFRAESVDVMKVPQSMTEQKFKMFCPTPFEVPSSFKKHTKVFGMGERNARALARELNASPSKSETIILFGCAGALDPQLKSGDLFEVTEVITEKAEFKLSQKTKNPSTRLWTSAHVVKGISDRVVIHGRSQARIVDMEMGFFYDEASPEVRSRTLFLRGVLDEIEADMSFFNENGSIKPSALFSPRQLKSMFRLVGALKKYKDQMNQALSQLDF